MKIRIKYSKNGAMRFVGHLDTLHYFQKAFRRTGLKTGFSKGFSPHMLLTFASPLSTGMTTEGDYLDIVIEEEMSPSEVLDRLSAQMSEGFTVTEAVRLREEAKTPMALLRAASYIITPALVPEDKARLIFSYADAFMEQESFTVVKKTKKGSREEDIRPLIYRLKACADAECDRPALLLMCASGSIEHLKPDLVMDSLSGFAASADEACRLAFGEEDEALLWHYHRTDLYGVDPQILKPGEPLGAHIPQPLLTVDIYQ